MWRPQDWEEDKFYKCMDLTCGGGEYRAIYEVFETGADAMLEALFKLAEESPTKEFVIDSKVINRFPFFRLIMVRMVL